MITCAAAAGLLAGLCGCKTGVQVSPDQRLAIFQEPQSQLVPVGGTASFSVLAKHIGPPSTNALAYQWRFNGVDVAGATNSTFVLASANFSNAGEYRVLVTGSSLLSNPAYLSVYSTTGTGGTLSTPIGSYSSQSWTCPNGGTFSKGYAVTNSQGRPALFYGPNATPQFDPFQNTSQLPLLTIDTFSTANGTVDTGIRIQNNWGTLQTACCNDDAGGGIQSQCTVTLSTNAGDVTHQNTYRLILFYKDPLPAGTTAVTFNWLYHN